MLQNRNKNTNYVNMQCKEMQAYLPSNGSMREKWTYKQWYLYFMFVFQNMNVYRSFLWFCSKIFLSIFFFFSFLFETDASSCESFYFQMQASNYSIVEEVIEESLQIAVHIAVTFKVEKEKNWVCMQSNFRLCGSLEITLFGFFLMQSQRFRSR